MFILQINFYCLTSTLQRRLNLEVNKTDLIGFYTDCYIYKQFTVLILRRIISDHPVSAMLQRFVHHPEAISLWSWCLWLCPQVKSVINLLFAAYTGDVSALRRWAFLPLNPISRFYSLHQPRSSALSQLCVLSPPSGDTMRMSTADFDGCNRRPLYDCMYDPLAVIISFI